MIIYVKNKVSLDTLSKNLIIPTYFNGTKTDVIESGVIKVLKGPATLVLWSDTNTCFKFLRADFDYFKYYLLKLL